MHDQKLTRLFERYRSKNDLAALAEVFDEVSPELLRVARHVAGRNVDPEDLVQGTFLAAIEHAHAYDTERPLVPWLLGILTNLSRSARRRTSTSMSEEVEDALTGGTRPVDDAEAREIDDKVHSALAQLPDTYRDVLVPHLAEGKKPHQIARDLGRPQGTVRAQIHRGIRLLRRTLPAGFSLGLVALFSSNSLAAVRARVLDEAARNAGVPSGEAARLGTEAAGRLLRRRLMAASVTIAAGVALWLAWPTRSPESGGAELARASAESTAPPLEGARAPIERSSVGDSPASVVTSTRKVEGDLGAVVVRVVDEAGLAPIAGARVQLIAWGDPAWFESSREERTGVDGSARFERVHAGRVGVVVDGGDQLRADVVAGETARVEARRVADVLVEALVTDARGTPVSGATVETFDARDGEPLANGSTTDARGRVRLAAHHARQFVAARAPGHTTSRLVALSSPAFARQDAAAPVPTIVLELGDAPRELAGRVVDESGNAVVGARVRATRPLAVQPEFGADGAARLESAPAFSLTDSRGEFSLAGLGAAPDEAVGDAWVVTLRVEAVGFAVSEHATALSAGFSDTLVLRREARVHGIVRFQDGAPAAFAEVRAELERRADAVNSGGTDAPQAASELPLARVTTRTDAAGGFTLPGLQPGRVTVSARAGTIGPVASATLVLSPGESREWMPIVEHVATIRGRAVGEDGRLVKTWLVLAVPEADEASSPSTDDDAFARSLWPDTASMAMQCWIDLQGNYVVPCASSGPHRLELRPREAWQGPVQAIREHVMPGSRGVDLRVPRARGLAHGRVVDGFGRPADVVAVTSHSRTVAGAGRAILDRVQGTYRVDLTPGRHDLVAWTVNGRPHYLGTVVMNGVERLDVPDAVLEAPGSVRVEIGQLTRDPLRVELRRVLDPAGHAANPDARRLGFSVAARKRGERAFEAVQLQPGAYELRVDDGGDEPYVTTIDVRAGERTEHAWLGR